MHTIVDRKIDSFKIIVILKNFDKIEDSNAYKKHCDTVTEYFNFCENKHNKEPMLY